MIKRALLATTALLLVAHSASADPASKRKLTEILKDKEVASNPERLLHALGSQDLSLTRGEMIGALGEAAAPRQARHLLSVAETLESKNGRVEMDRLLANGVRAPDGRIMAFNSDLSYWVDGRDLRGIRGLYAAKDPQSGMERIRVVRDAAPKPPAPEAPPVTPPATRPTPPHAETPDGPNGAPLEQPLPPAPSTPAPATPAPATPAPATPAPAGNAETPEGPNPGSLEPRVPEGPTPASPAPSAPAVASTAAPSIGIAGALRRHLVPGSEGDEVRAMQEQLNLHLPENDSPLTEDGKFGARTQQAVKDFQAIHGLPQTGVIDSATRAALESAKLLKKGDKGAQVSEVQRLLNTQRGSEAPLEEDEAFGPRTEQAVKDFQASKGLPQTGVVDAATLRALRGAARPEQPAQPGQPAQPEQPAASTPTVAPTTLERGQESDAVKDLQQEINRHRRAAGQEPIEEDGKFGPGTERAVREFQEAKGLDATGRADVGTAAELSKEVVRPRLSSGDEGAGVKALQEELNRHRRAAGQAPIKEDGKFGAGTKQALEEFQRSKGLPTTGAADAGTNAELNKAPARPRLAQGARGDAVKSLQKTLNEHRRAAGQAPLVEDGEFGAGTKKALEEFQAAKGIPTSGTLDSATGTALDSPPVQAEAIKRGDEGEKVRELQKDLNKHRAAKGQRAIPEDGKFGAGTEQALKDFQNDAGLSPSGEADGATQSAADAQPDTSQSAIDASSSELEILARIVKGECPADVPWEGKVAVAAVVLNRVRSSRFPNSIQRVAHQPKQFSCYNSNVRRRLYFGPIPDYAWRAARAALAGQDPSGGADHYFNPYIVLPKWARRLKFIRRIGTPGTLRTRKRTTHDFYVSRR
jgi:peptidoglycan hydrolase-like protein with peptidoglycan-binding domain